MKHDYLQFVLIFNIAAVVIAVITAIILAANNAGSKNLPLAAAALIGITVGYVIQLPFELSRTVQRKTIGVEMTIDRSEPVIRQWVYPDRVWVGLRLFSEVNASKWLAEKDRSAFDNEEQRKKMTQDLIIFSIVSYLTKRQHDWQMQRESYGAFETWQPLSKPEECSYLDGTEIRKQLESVGNLFAGAPLNMLTPKVCLPPGSTINILHDGVTITNPLCQMDFKISENGGTFNVDPKTRMYVAFDDGPRYQTRVMGIRATTIFFALRAQSRNRKRAEEWAADFVNGLGEWFSPGNPREAPQRVVPAQ